MIQDAGDLLRGADGAVGQGHARRFVKMALGGGNRVAVRIGCGVAEQFVDPFQNQVGDGMFQLVGLIVNG